MSTNQEFVAMLHALERVFRDENRPGGDMAADALRAARRGPVDLVLPRRLEIAEIGMDLIRKDDHPAAAAILAAFPLIDWHHSGLENGKIRPEIARSMATSELIGPDGMIFDPDVRVGLFVQMPVLDYVTRTHPAEETFVMLGGVGYWTCEGAPLQRCGVGDFIHHPANARHASVTQKAPLIAAWRWTGDIDFDGYKLVG